jgi:hypothetical protein
MAAAERNRVGPKPRRRGTVERAWFRLQGRG